MYFWSTRNIFFSRHFTFFHHVGIRINSRLSTFIYVGWKKTFVSATKFILYTAGSSVFLLLGILGMSFYSSNEPTLNFESLTNQSYPVALEIISIWDFLLLLLSNHQLYPYIHGYLIPWRGALQHLYAFSRNIIKNGSIWVGSN
ncbi:hypothetical protein V8G54_000036 (mitochondrion) [Vigna mungo]|uniref:Uncharacterized protein n=1 Tax=Vigna mungo TaxID=3915 RepID=A0AAQ3PKR1_VIGMU